MEVVNGSHEKHEATILGFDTASSKGIKRKKETTISGRKEREFSEWRRGPPRWLDFSVVSPRTTSVTHPPPYLTVRR